MIVIDNFFPEDFFNQLSYGSDAYEWKFGRTDNGSDIYWTKHIYGRILPPGDGFISQFKEPLIEECWEFLRKKFSPFVSVENLETCYLNGLTYGIESYQHRDASKEDKGVTVICYLCNNWNSNWCGETVFFDKDYVNDFSSPVYYTNEITKSVLPKPNRVVLFESSTVHAVRPLSKSFKGLRTTLMFKLVNVNKEEIFKVCN